MPRLLPQRPLLPTLQHPLPPRPHRLRQTFATGMLASGATLQEVQGLLRHAHLRTTALYAKVDKNRLTALAPEWPAAASLGRCPR